MARTYGPLLTSIWSDPDFRALSAEAQRVYLLAWSQPNITYAGVVPYTDRRWARMASNTRPEDIDKAVGELEERHFIMLDEETEELFVRTFVKHNKVLEQPQLRTAMRRAFTEILSAPIRAAFLAGLPADERRHLQNGTSEPISQGAEHPASSLPPGSDAAPGSGSTRARGDHPEPLTPNSDRDQDTSSRRPAVTTTGEDGRPPDDDDRAAVLAEVWEALAVRNLERRNRAVSSHGGEAVSNPARRQAWKAEDMKRSEEILGPVARMYLEADSTLGAAEVLELLDSDAATALAESPLLEDPT